MISATNADAYTELVLYFEEKKKCQEAKDFIDFKRKEQLDLEKQKIQQFLCEVCDEEVVKVMEALANWKF